MSPKRRVLTRPSLDQPSRVRPTLDPIGSPARWRLADQTTSRGAGFLLTAQGWPYPPGPSIPLAIALDLANVSASAIFFTAASGSSPPRRSRAWPPRSCGPVGPRDRGRLNVTFGNAPELIIALFALGEGLQEVVKASIIGSILGNILLVLGAAMLVGGIGRDRQRFNATAANVQSLMLFLAAAALVMPAIFELVEGQGLPSVNAERVDYGSTVEHLSVAVAARARRHLRRRACVFSLKTHRDIFNPPDEQDEETAFGWSPRRSVRDAGDRRGGGRRDVGGALAGSIAEASESWGSASFLGVIIVAIVGNAPEHWSACWSPTRTRWTCRRHRDRVECAGGAVRRAALVFASRCSSARSRWRWSSTASSLAPVGLAVLIANFVTHEGETTWLEGVQLLAV